MLKNISEGLLEIVVGSETYVFGASSIGCAYQARIIVKNEAFWTRLLLTQDLGFAEAYMFGDCEL